MITTGFTPLLVAGLTLPLAVTGASAAEPSGDKWVVGLGDSYMSGEGGNITNRHLAAGSVEEVNNNAWNGWRITDPGDGTTAAPFYFDKVDPATGNAIAEETPWCHRAPSAPSYIGGAYKTLNLACSGAEALSKVNVPVNALGTPQPQRAIPKPGVDFEVIDFPGSNVAPAQVIEGQAKRLQEFVEAGHDVEIVTLSIGGNDFGFANIATICGSSYVTLVSDCTGQNSDNGVPPGGKAQPVLAETNVNYTAERVRQAVQNIHTAMRNAGKADNEWKLIYQLPPMPIPEPAEFVDDFIYTLPSGGETKNRVALGCPIANSQAWDASYGVPGVMDLIGAKEDAAWLRNEVGPTMANAMLKGVMAADLGETPLIVLDPFNAFADRELCNRDVEFLTNYQPGTGLPTWSDDNGAGTEWIVPVSFSPPHNLSESLHPNYWGQRALAACMDGAADLTRSAYVTCEQSPTGGLDPQGRPAMRALEAS